MRLSILQWLHIASDSNLDRDELRAGHAEAAEYIESLTSALGKLEKANEQLAANRSVRTYHSIVQDGAEELLIGLDRARLEARQLLQRKA